MDALATSTADKTAATARVVVVTGVSGAGKSSALRALEDMGFETVAIARGAEKESFAPTSAPTTTSTAPPPMSPPS